MTAISQRNAVWALLAPLAFAALSSCVHGQPTPSGEQRRTGPAMRQGKPYTVAGVTYYPLEDAYGFRQTGVASWYGRDFHGKKTANGETYDMNAMTAAHKTLPLGSMVEVKRVDDGRVAVVRINDRGPFAHNRIIDLSMAGAKKLGVVDEGTTMVTLTALAEGKPGEGDAPPDPVKPLPDFNKGTFWVQVGAFAVKSNAEKVRDRLLFPREDVQLLPARMAGGETLIRVRVGPFSEMDIANKALKEAVTQGFDTSFVVAD